MIQGGDPTGTGRGGSSIYGYTCTCHRCMKFPVYRINFSPYSQVFEDEIRDDLKHTGAGILSMANRYYIDCTHHMILNFNLFYY